MTWILRSLIVAALAALLAGTIAKAQAQRQPQPVPEASEDVPAEDEAQPPDEEQEESADTDTNTDADAADAEEEPPPTPAQPQRRVVTPQRPQPVTPQRVQPARQVPAQTKPQTPARARVQPPVPVQAQDPDALPSLDELTATRERPLFSSTRRPPEVEEAEEPSGPITEGGSMPFELVGIVLGSDVSAAIFRNTESKEETRVAKGDMIGNWSVEEIVERSVVLRGNAKRVRMRMFDEANAPGIQVGRVGGEDDPAAEPPAATEDENAVDEDIAPSSSPQVRPATAQPKPPPSLQNKDKRRAARPTRPNQRARQQQRQQP